ncbi:MAG: serine/threonine-protein phosphatase [Deltaproteobacteria bacterium]|nr:serine/threonine-protein phosphatase [Deltaproteobacteria bacterium]
MRSPRFLHQQGTTSRLAYAAGTTAGTSRDVNDDVFAIFDDVNTAVVVDGCGGVSAGNYAAKQTIDCFREILRDRRDSRRTMHVHALEPLAVAIMEANKRIFRAASANTALRGQSAALSAVRAFEQGLAIAHVGDCRVAHYRHRVLTWLTEDHSLLSEMRRIEAPRDEIAAAEKAYPNVITRAIGLGEHIVTDVTYHPASPGDMYLLCSDGLSRQLRRERITEVIEQHAADLRACCAALLDASEAAGGRDNATVILLRLHA